jgi:transcriptional regulator with XRE-family HTH domain
MIAASLAGVVSANVIYLRARAGLSQTALCERARISRDTLSRIERGEADPTLSVLEKIALALDASVGDLFIDDGADDSDDSALARLAAAGRKGAVSARALIAATDEAAGRKPTRYSAAGRPRLAR